MNKTEVLTLVLIKKNNDKFKYWLLLNYVALRAKQPNICLVLHITLEAEVNRAKIICGGGYVCIK